MYLSPRTSPAYQPLALIGLAALCVALGATLVKPSISAAYSDGVFAGKALAEQDPKTLLANEDVVRTACYAGWFGKSHRLSKQPRK